MVLALAACGASSTQTFRNDGFYGEQPYRIVNGPNGAIAPNANWYIDNYQIDKNGGLGAPKGGANYTHVIRLDSDGDGDLNMRRKFATYDLLFRHLKNDGLIWVRTPPMSAQFRETDLRVLALNYVDAVSGTGKLVSDPEAEGSASVERRFATRVLEASEATLDGRPAFTVTFEVANVDQLQLAQDSRWERARVILVRPGFQYRANEADFPVLMLLGYSNRPEDFEEGREAFDQLISRVQFLSEQELVATRSDEIFECEKAAGNELHLLVYVDPEGKPYWASAFAPGGKPKAPPPPTTAMQSSTPRPCVANALDTLAFQASGAERKLGVRLVRGRPVRSPRGFVQAQAPAAAPVAPPAPTAEPPAPLPQAPPAAAAAPASALAPESAPTP